jgi:hypothetical protein
VVPIRRTAFSWRIGPRAAYTTLRSSARPVGSEVRFRCRRRGQAPRRPIGPRNPNSGSGGRERSARQSPSRRRRGNQSCGRPQAAAHRRCSPTRPGARRPHRRAAGAPTRQRRSARSLGGQAPPIALLVYRDALVIAAGGAGPAGDRPSICAPPGRREVLCRATHGAIYLVRGS